MILAEAHRCFTQNFDLLLFKHFFSTTKKGSQVFTSHFQALSYTCAWRIDARNTDPAKKLHALFSAKIIEGLTHIFQEDLLPVLFSSSVIQASKKRQFGCKSRMCTEFPHHFHLLGLKLGKWFLAPRRRSPFSYFKNKCHDTENRWFITLPHGKMCQKLILRRQLDLRPWLPFHKTSVLTNYVIHKVLHGCAKCKKK